MFCLTKEVCEAFLQVDFGLNTCYEKVVLNTLTLKVNGISNRGTKYKIMILVIVNARVYLLKRNGWSFV